jgi:predicted nucleotidyltransferase component of viral defense system
LSTVGVPSTFHEASCFTKDSMISNSKKYEFADPIVIELFLWDIEITAQVQSVSDKFLLKGGASVQLHLPPEYQRGSKDIDLVTSLDENGIAQVLTETEKKFGNVHFVSYTPKNPKDTSLLRTYQGETSAKTRDNSLHIKMDFLMHALKLATCNMGKRSTFVGMSPPIVCFAPEVIVGDKLLTLAKGSVGLESMNDCPKQVYDICMLLRYSKFSKFEDTLDAIEKLVSVECQMLGKSVTPSAAIMDVVQFIDDDIAPLDTSKPNKELRKAFQNFEQFYPPKSQRANFEEWSTRGLRVRYIARLALEAVSNGKEPGDCLKLLNKAESVCSRFKGVTGQRLATARKTMLSFLKTPLAYSRELNGKPFERVFWQAVTPDNTEALDKAL